MGKLKFDKEQLERQLAEYMRAVDGPDQTIEVLLGGVVMKLRVVTVEEWEQIKADVDTWFKKVRVRFNNAQSTARIAVAEYIANQRGLTLFPEREGDEIE